MRFLGVTETCDLGSLYMRLIAEGHEVRVSVQEPLAQGTMAGLVPRCADWRHELDWVREAGGDGCILFEAVSEGFGAEQDRLRAAGFTVVGGSAFGDRLENDRAFAFERLDGLGFDLAGVHAFDDAAEADRFLADRPGRYVLKFSGPGFSSSDNFVGQLPDGRDVREMLRLRFAGFETPPRFILMDFVEGIEMGVGAYFNGEDFLLPACLDWEHKRFFPGDLGELTGEMGTVATFEGSQSFFDRTLRRAGPMLRDAGHVGYVNLNTIVNEAGIWPLEFTCRFGYPGYSVLEPLQEIGWGDLLKRIARRDSGGFPFLPGFSVGVVLTTPPFPYSRKEVAEPVGLPIMLGDALSAEDRRHLHFCEMGSLDGQLVTSGLYGWTMVVTGAAPEIGTAQELAYARCRKLSIPNLRYRQDIGERLRMSDHVRLRQWGVID